jgi:hypothetical protein
VSRREAELKKVKKREPSVFETKRNSLLEQISSLERKDFIVFITDFLPWQTVGSLRVLSTVTSPLRSRMQVCNQLNEQW